jgi:hypothetical protein
MKTHLLLLAAAALLPAALRASHIDFVIVNATASPDYTNRKFANGSPRPETYVFYEGKYFDGTTHDASIARTSFLDIARILAPNLAKQNYLPTRDVAGADLLIVVNWGTTATDQTTSKSDAEFQFRFKDEFSDVQSYNTAVAGYQAGQGGAMALPPDPANVTMDLMTDQAKAMSAQKYSEFNASLLGYTNTLRKEMSHQWASANGLGSEAESHLSDLNEERYFVILQVYDFQKLRHDREAGAPAPAPAGAAALPAFTRPAPAAPAPVWTMRINIRATGNNFKEALPAMSRVASDYFGKQLDDLKSEPTEVGRNADVEIGNVKVLSVDR